MTTTTEMPAPRSTATSFDILDADSLEIILSKTSASDTLKVRVLSTTMHNAASSPPLWRIFT